MKRYKLLKDIGSQKAGEEFNWVFPGDLKNPEYFEEVIDYTDLRKHWVEEETKVKDSEVGHISDELMEAAFSEHGRAQIKSQMKTLNKKCDELWEHVKAIESFLNLI